MASATMAGGTTARKVSAVRLRAVGIIVQRRLGKIDIGNLRIEKSGQQPHQSALGLPLLAEKEHVVSGDQRDIDLGHNCVVVAEDAGKQLLALAKHAEKVVLDFLLDGLRRPAARAQIA